MFPTQTLVRGPAGDDDEIQSKRIRSGQGNKADGTKVVSGERLLAIDVLATCAPINDSWTRRCFSRNLLRSKISFVFYRRSRARVRSRPAFHHKERLTGCRRTNTICCVTTVLRGIVSAPRSLRTRQTIRSEPVDASYDRGTAQTRTKEACVLAACWFRSNYLARASSVEMKSVARHRNRRHGPAYFGTNAVPSQVLDVDQTAPRGRQDHKLFARLQFYALLHCASVPTLDFAGMT